MINIIVYVSLILIKFLFFCLFGKFNFLFYQSMEFFAFNQKHMNYFSNYPTVTHTWLWSFFGNLPLNNLSKENNSTDSLHFFNDSYYLDHTMILYIIGFASACIIIPLVLLFKSLIIFRTKKIWNYNLITILTQICFLGFMPITTLCIKEFLAIETNTFELSLVTICLFSSVTITFPALIYRFIYGENKRKWRRRLYYLLDSFHIKYKFFSIILMLKQIISSIILNIFAYNKILSNSLFTGFNLFFLLYYIIKKPFEKPYFHFMGIFNTSIELIILCINFIILNVEKTEIPIYISLVIQVFFFISNLIIIHKNKTYKRELIPHYQLNNEEMEMEDIYTLPILDSIKCTIPEWAKKEYIENKIYSIDQPIFTNINSMDDVIV